ncbi:MAG: LPXTG cell wall anchor domain-containing protein, partial [Bowdeniella nasicola]|nr:LPXTG cell wall anchor domain-containing protein [Bowdeniella nasicola]
CPAPAPSDDPTDEPTVAPTDQPTAKPTGPGKPPLPITGSDLAIPGLIALGLLSAGGALAIRKRAAQR